jgi:prepilin-type N-terminal cleavage/methylation domain-containing protein
MNNRRGFTIVEVLIAIVLLSLGILSLAGSAGGITKMMYNGQRKTRSYTIAESILDSLRNVANSTSPKCSSAMVNGTTTSPDGFAAAWRVAGSGTSRQARVIIAYQSGRRAQADTMYLSLLC